MEISEIAEENVDVAFRRIGGGVSLLPPDSELSQDNPLARSLAVSNRFGITFFATSKGFGLVLTKDVVELSKDSKPQKIPSICDKCIANVDLPNVRLLNLSKDELTLAVCDGTRIQLFRVADLVHKTEKTPIETRDIGSALVKDFQWCSSEEDKYFVLSTTGSLLLGKIGEEPKLVKTDVSAASWNPYGKQIAYVIKMQLTISSHNLSKSTILDLPPELPGMDEGLDVQVDSLYWLSSKDMLISYIQTDEMDEIACPLFGLSANEGLLNEECSQYSVVNVPRKFAAIDYTILPPKTGPYMLVQNLEPWKLVLTACRRSVDDHLVLLGFLPQEDREIISAFNLANDQWRPVIPMFDSSSDNVLNGLAIDRTSSLQQPDPRNLDELLPPSPILLCSLLDQRICIYSILRLDDKKWYSPGLVAPPSSLDELTTTFFKQGDSREDQRFIDKQQDFAKPQTPHSDKQLGIVASNKDQVLSTRILVKDQIATAKGSPQTNSAIVIENPSRPTLATFSASKTVNEQLRKAQLDLNQKEQSISRDENTPRTVTPKQPQQFEFAKLTRQPSVQASAPSNIAPSTVPAKISSPPVSLSQKKEEVASRGAEKQSLRHPGISDMEADFLAELAEVRKMGDEVDAFMSVIHQKPDNSGSFTRGTIEKLEDEISVLLSESRDFKRKLQENSQLVEELRDQSLDVDAWRIYVESRVEQATDSRYRDLWVHRKLHPEMDIKRKHVLSADEKLKRQITELEAHLHSLELNQRQQTYTRQSPNKLASSGQFQSVQCLYNTVNAQMDAAEKLSAHLAELMGLLNIPVNAASLKSRRSDKSSVPTKQPKFKPENGPCTPPKSILSDDMGFTAPESTRRRRDSMDSAWAGIEATKTTIKRVTRAKAAPSSKEPGNVKLSSSSKSTSLMGLQDDNVPSKEFTSASFSLSRHAAAHGPAKMGASTEFPGTVASRVAPTAPSPSFLALSTSSSSNGAVITEPTKASIPRPSLLGSNLGASPVPVSFGPATVAKVSSSISVFPSPPSSAAFPQLKLTTTSGSVTIAPTSTSGSSSTSVSHQVSLSAAQTSASFLSKFSTSLPATRAASDVIKSSNVPSSFGPQVLTLTSGSSPSKPSKPAISVSTSSQPSTPAISASTSSQPSTPAISASASSQPSTPAISASTSSQPSAILASSPSKPSTTATTSDSKPASTPAATFEVARASSNFSFSPPTTQSAVSAAPSVAAFAQSASAVPQTSTVSSKMPSNLFAVSSQPASTMQPAMSLSLSTASTEAASKPSNFGLFSTSMQQAFGTLSSTASPSPFPAQPQQNTQVQPPVRPAPEEDDMDEEAPSSASAFSGFGNLGLGSSVPQSSPSANPFGVSPNPQPSLFGGPSSVTPPPSGQLFRPAAFSLPSASSSPPSSTTGSGFMNLRPSFPEAGPFSKPAQPAAGFGQPSGFGQQSALGSALGAFGQTRQMGFGPAAAPPSAAPSAASTGFSFASSGGFASAATSGGGFQAFSQNQSAGGFAGFASGNATPGFGAVGASQTSASPLFTAMRK